MTKTDSNPLLDYTVKLPLFKQIKPVHALPALTAQLASNRQQLTKLLQQDKFTWANLMLPLQQLDVDLMALWSPIGHLNAVLNTAEWRAAYNECLPLLTAYNTELGQNHELYQAIAAIKQQQYQQLNSVQQKIIDDALQDFRLAGVALEGQAKQRYAAIQQRLSELSTKFEENLLDATRQWFFHTEDQTRLAGIPEHIMQFAQATAQSKQLPGYVLTLDLPCYQAVMKYADDAALRALMYRHFTTRASDQVVPNDKQTQSQVSVYDNSAIMVEILNLRQEKAGLLGFASYADYSLATKMAESVPQVSEFLVDLAQRSKPFAQQELAKLTQFAQDQLGLEQLAAWDLAYVAEKYQQAHYALSDEMLRPYFPEDKVFQGMFDVIKCLYGMTVKAVDTDELWYDQVRLFAIYDQDNQLRGQFYADLYARPQKRGGAWMDDCRVRYIKPDGQVNIPVAYLVCNFTQAVADQPALLTHDEVITLFHEFGHGLHHLLTQVDYASAAGINGVEWDAVELPSQFMENFCWDKTAIKLCSGHYQTGEQLPEALFNKLLAAKNSQSGLAMLRQLEFALFDLRVHSEPAPDQASAIQVLLTQVRQAVAVLMPPDYNRFQHSFSHIFAGGYAAGYYSYKWAEVLSSDVFAKFAQHGVLSRDIGEAFLAKLLAKGSTEPAMQLFKDFMGRAPNVDALLASSGLTHDDLS